MRARMFKPQFAALVKSGVKRQTIRPTPKRMPRVGDVESWRQWSGKPYRSKQIELAQVQIVSVERIKMDETEREFLISLSDRPLNGALLPIEEWNAFAIADGFKSMLEMVNWFAPVAARSNTACMARSTPWRCAAVANRTNANTSRRLPSIAPFEFMTLTNNFSGLTALCLRSANSNSQSIHICPVVRAGSPVSIGFFEPLFAPARRGFFRKVQTV